MKRLIVCCDGTWQSLVSKYPSNVVKIAQAIAPIGDDGVPQIVFYNEGVGTGGDLLDTIGGGIFGWGLDRAIQHAYQFLCLNYEVGDRIYLFGFSRGAYTVRSLAGLIYNVGLLNRPHIRKTPEAYQFYQDRSEDTKPSSPQAKAFRDRYSQEVDINFLGCWDTVGALGIPDQIPFFPLDNILNKKYEFHDTRINRRIECARHAVAIDEKRKAFYVTPMLKSDRSDNQDLKQVWFPGGHGCVGGGTEATRQLSDAALKWMLDEAIKTGLSCKFEPIEGGIVLDPNIPFEDAPTGLFAPIETRIRQLSDNLNANPAEYLHATFEDIHESAKQRWCAIDYHPEGLKAFETRLDDRCS
jgi:uncharacterized protein (DUF2235 family)